MYQPKQAAECRAPELLPAPAAWRDKQDPGDALPCEGLLKLFQQCDMFGTSPAFELPKLSKAAIKSKRRITYTVDRGGEEFEVVFAKTSTGWVVKRLESSVYE